MCDYKLNNRQYIVCGDFNARCANETDFIAGLDKISDCHVIDFENNSYGELFTDFLINNNCVMLNGRCNSDSH